MSEDKAINITKEERERCNKIIHLFVVVVGGACGGIRKLSKDGDLVITSIQVAMLKELGEIFNQKISDYSAQAIVSESYASLLDEARTSYAPTKKYMRFRKQINLLIVAKITEDMAWIAIERFSKDNNE